MAKVGIEVRIDVTKIEKARIYEGQKGKYLTVTTFVDLDQQDQYGNNGMVTHKKEQGEERAPILGNAKVFWTDGGQQPQQPQQQQAPQQGGGFDDFDSDIPF
jgi:single-stranded DNA-binding protein